MKNLPKIEPGTLTPEPAMMFSLVVFLAGVLVTYFLVKSIKPPKSIGDDKDILAIADYCVKIVLIVIFTLAAAVKGLLVGFDLIGHWWL